LVDAHAGLLHRPPPRGVVFFFSSVGHEYRSVFEEEKYSSIAPKQNTAEKRGTYVCVCVCV